MFVFGQSYERDVNRDGLVDSLHVEIETPLLANESILQVTTVVWLNYSLQVESLPHRIDMKSDSLAVRDSLELRTPQHGRHGRLHALFADSWCHV